MQLLDASALLALIFSERGADVVAEAVEAGAAMSTVNIAEVAATLHQSDWTAEEVPGVIDALNIEALAFDDSTALLSGQLRPKTRPLGLSLGDRACLATAQTHGLRVLTCDRIWLQISIPGVEIACAR